MVSKCQRVRLCPNLSLPGWHFPSSNIQFPLVSPHCLHSLCLQSEVCTEFHEARLRLQDPITPDHASLSQLYARFLYFLLISTFTLCAAKGMMESQQRNDGQEAGGTPVSR